MTDTPASAAADLQHPLRDRLRPLLLLLAVVVAFSAPLAWFTLRLEDLREQAVRTGDQVAALLRREVDERPTLWRYDSLKLVAHVQPLLAQADVQAIRLADRSGATLGHAALDLDGSHGAGLREALTLWQAVPLRVGDAEVGTVWVAMSTRRSILGTLELLVLFGSLAAALCGLLWWVPLRTAAQAEARIGKLLGALGQSESALARLAATLEAQVTERTAELHLREQQLRELAARTFGLQENERRAIARDLHDDAGQTLTALRIELQVLRQRAGPDLQSPTAEAVALADQALEDIRRAVYTLAPPVLDEVGLQEALRRQCDNFAERTRLAVTLEPGPSVRLPAAIETACYRIVQEALTNVARHAAATTVRVALTPGDGKLTLHIEDDGRGTGETARQPADAQVSPADAQVSPADPLDSQTDPLLPPRPKRDSGLVGRGVHGMRERAELLGGRFSLVSRPLGGTAITVVLPLDVPTGRAA